MIDEANKRTRNIRTWMESFKSAWIGKDIDAVFALLAEDLEYWETPFLKMGKNDPALRAAWHEILPLQDMQLDYEIQIGDNDTGKYAITYHFKHTKGESAGVYLVSLNEKGLCTYFFRTSMKGNKVS